MNTSIRFEDFESVVSCFNRLFAVNGLTQKDVSERLGITLLNLPD